MSAAAGVAPIEMPLSAKDVPSIGTTAPVRMTRHDVGIVLPCPGCSHAQVCRIKPVLEAATTSVSLPAFESAISIEPVTIKVACALRSQERKTRGWSDEQRAAAADRLRVMQAAKKAKL